MWQALKSGTLALPAHIRIPDRNVGAGLALEPLVADQSYFTVQVNELFLYERRKWWETYIPTVWTSVQFAYDSTTRAVPYLIGPSMLTGNDLGAPEGMLYRNTRVAGPHPYKGGPVTVSLVLNRVTKDNYADRVVSIVESTAAAFSVATTLAPYLAVAQSVTRGLEVLLDMGSEPVMGVRDTISADVPAASDFATGYYALLDKAIPPERLWVRDGELHTGPDRADTRPVRDRSFLLYSVTALPRRNDVLQLAGLRPLWNRVQEFAQRPDEPSWLTAKTAMTDLGILLRTHPDLVTPQADAVYADWAGQMVKLHQERVLNAPKGGTPPPLSSVDSDILAITQQIMKL